MNRFSISSIWREKKTLLKQNTVVSVALVELGYQDRQCYKIFYLIQCDIYIFNMKALRYLWCLAYSLVVVTLSLLF